MKYIIINDFHNIFDKRIKLIITILLMACIWVILQNNSIQDTNYFLRNINYAFSYKIDFKYDIQDVMTLSINILNYGLFLLLAVDIYKNDKANYDNLLERINLNKWVISKVIVNTLFAMLISIITFIIVKIFSPYPISCLIILKKVLVISILTCYIYLLLILYKKNIPLFIISLIPIISILFITIDLRLINIIYLILVFIIMFILLNILCYYTKFSDIKE